MIRAIRSKAPDATVFGLFSPGRWTGARLQGEGEQRIAVYQCDSPLQMRLALQDAGANTPPAVLVTPLDQDKISDDILIRIAFRKLFAINSWEIVRSLFNAKQLDPRITRHVFLADLLLDHTGTRDFPPAAGGLLDADTVWGILLKERLGLSEARPDLAELIRCSAESDLVRRWQACSSEFRKAASEWIAETAGEAAHAVLSCIAAERGLAALAIGLAMGVIYHDTVGHELDKAAGRLEAWVGSSNVAVETARRWRDASSVCIGSLPKPVLRNCLDEAESIVSHVGAAPHAWRSNELESGFEQRLARFGHRTS